MKIWKGNIVKYEIDFDKSVKKFYSIVIIIVLLILGLYMFRAINIEVIDKPKKEKQLIIV